MPVASSFHPAIGDRFSTGMDAATQRFEDLVDAHCREVRGHLDRFAQPCEVDLFLGLLGLPDDLRKGLDGA